MLLKNFAAGDGVASRDQESVQPSADDLDCRLPDSPIRGVDFRLRISPRIRIRKLVCGTYADLNYAKTSEN